MFFKLTLLPSANICIPLSSQFPFQCLYLLFWAATYLSHNLYNLSLFFFLLFFCCLIHENCCSFLSFNCLTILYYIFSRRFFFLCFSAFIFSSLFLRMSLLYLVHFFKNFYLIPFSFVSGFNCERIKSESNSLTQTYPPYCFYVFTFWQRK